MTPRHPDTTTPGAHLPHVGATVHYASHGTPPREDGGQAHPARCRAAMVTAVGRDADPLGIDPEAVALFVMNPTGVFLNTAVAIDLGETTEDAGELLARCPITGRAHLGGTWHPIGPHIERQIYPVINASAGRPITEGEVRKFFAASHGETDGDQADPIADTIARGRRDAHLAAIEDREHWGPTAIARPRSAGGPGWEIRVVSAMGPAPRNRRILRSFEFPTWPKEFRPHALQDELFREGYHPVPYALINTLAPDRIAGWAHREPDEREPFQQWTVPVHPVEDPRG